MTKISYVHGIQPAELVDLDDFDVTAMTAAQLDAYQSARILLAQADNEADPYVREGLLEAADRMLGAMGWPVPMVGGLDDVWDNVKDAFKKAINKLVNLVLKTLLPAAGPVFLYLFIQKPVKAGSPTARKQAKIQRVFNAMLKATGMSRNSALKAIREGIHKKFGMSPEALLAAKGVNAPGWSDGPPPSPTTAQGPKKIGWVQAVLAILPLAISLFKEIMKVTGKKADLDLSKDDLPDAGEYSRDTDTGGQSGGNSGGQTGGNTGRDNTPLLLIGGGLAAILLLNNKN